MDTYYNNMEWPWTFSRAFSQEALMESTQSHRIVFSACFWLKTERATDNGVETKNQDHISWSRIHELNCCCQALYMFLKCSRLEEVVGYNKTPWPILVFIGSWTPDSRQKNITPTPAPSPTG